MNGFVVQVFDGFFLYLFVCFFMPISVNFLTASFYTRVTSLHASLFVCVHVNLYTWVYLQPYTVHIFTEFVLFCLRLRCYEMKKNVGWPNGKNQCSRCTYICIFSLDTEAIKMKSKAFLNMQCERDHDNVAVCVMLYSVLQCTLTHRNDTNLNI